MSSDSAPSGSTGNRSRDDEPDAPLSAGPTQADAPASPRCNALILSFLSFVLIVFGVWLFSAGRKYRAEYAHSMEGWRVGSTRVVELTLIRQDKQNLACAADHEVEGLQCGYRSDSQPVATSADDPRILNPWNTVGNELLLGAGLWNSPGLQGPLPDTRFSVICNYAIKGVMRSALVRFDPAAGFSPIGRPVTVGTLTNCVLPR